MLENERPKRANVRDVARHAAVSVATVSRVLNRAGNVSDTTRVRVERAIADLRFVPSSAARAINSGRTRLVGAVIPAVDHAVFARFVTALEDQFDQLDLSLIVANTNHDPERELDRARKLLNAGVEGLIVSGTTRAPGFDALIAQHQVPVIATSCFDPRYDYPTFGYNNRRVARKALRHLIELGHRDIAVMHGFAAQNDRVRARLMGLRGWHDARLSLHEVEMSFAEAGRVVTDIWHRRPATTALLCFSDVLAQGALIRLHAEGVSLPGQFSVVGIDDLHNSSSQNPPLTTVHLPARTMGTHVADAMAHWIEEGKRPAPLCLDTDLITRASTAPPSVRAPRE